MNKVAFILGVGASNGLGAAIARRFARENLHVCVAGRTADNLNAVKQEIEAQGGVASIAVCDATDSQQIHHALNSCEQYGQLSAVIFNVGNNAHISFADLKAEQFEKFWRVCTYSGFLTAKEALPRLKKHGGSLLFTGASASLRGRPGFAHFAAAKAGLRSMAQALAKDYGPKGVHVAHVVVDGAINGERLRSALPEYLDRLGEDGSLDPDAIAELYWLLHAQPRNAWSFELDVRPYKEVW
ncbi:SDR family NAD(P)-dependent oxidoreductase [Litorivivens sp.]|uniref:SDR family NAD(P)-dependent oxidoreductase n=1 Tax=Litorivivens sp. TaxID=2020868 RepID=UPI003561C0BF